MSSLRNAAQRRNHKERAQPVERQRWGVLEKHKDYSLRARNFQEKKNRLGTLRQKAAERNPDEFSYGMLSKRQSKQGTILGDRGNRAINQDAVKLLKTQDAGYLSTMLQKTRRALDKLQKEFFLPPGEGPQAPGKPLGYGKRRHIILAGDKEEQQQSIIATNIRFNFNAPNERQDAPSGLIHEVKASRERPDITSHETPKSNRAAESEELFLKEQSLLRKRFKKVRDAKKSKSAALRIRIKELADAEAELGLQRAKMSNSIGGATKAGVRWKIRERKT